MSNIPLHKPLIVRTHKCSNGHRWNGEVVWRQTRNLSGELKSFCPICSAEATYSTSWRILCPWHLSEAYTGEVCPEDAKLPLGK